jgi:hypothetical protein
MTEHPSHTLRIRFEALLKQPTSAFLHELRSLLDFLNETPPFPEHLTRLREECSRLMSEFRERDAGFVSRLVELRKRNDVAPALGSSAPIDPNIDPFEYQQSIQYFDRLAVQPELSRVDPFGTDDDLRAKKMGDILHNKVEEYRWLTRDGRGNFARTEHDQHPELEDFAFELVNVRNEITEFHQDFISRKRSSPGFALLLCEDSVSKITRRKSAPFSKDPVERKKQVFEKFDASMEDYLSGNQGARAALYEDRPSKEDKASLERAVEPLRPLVERVYRQLQILVGSDSPTLNQNFYAAVGAVQVGEGNRAKIAREHGGIQSKLMDQCSAAFLKLHAAISSVTGENFPIADLHAWHGAYLAKRQEVELIADELVAVTRLCISDELADRVEALRREYRQWEVHFQVYERGLPQADKAFEQMVTIHPRKILAKLESLTGEYRKALGLQLPKARATEADSG